MKSQEAHPHHNNISIRLKRAGGHLHRTIAMVEEGHPCPDIAQQLQAVEKAIGQAKKTLIHDHIDHCLEERLKAGKSGGVDPAAIRELKDITKYL